MKMVPAPPPTSSSSPMMSSSQHQKFEVTEDTPVDFLEGCMEILVVFPNEKSILMSIQRRFVIFLTILSTIETGSTGESILCQLTGLLFTRFSLLTDLTSSLKMISLFFS